MACRDEASALESIRELKDLDSTADIHFRKLDLTSVKSVEQFAAKIVKGNVN